MEVQLFDYTGCGSPNPARHAANVLVFTKQTRLNMVPGLFNEISNWSSAKIHEELEYMANTIPSSWEFIHYNFLVNGVTRGFTHQFVRTRTGAYAQQTMRVLNVEGWDYGTGPTIEGDADAQQVYQETMTQIAEAYKALVENGIAIEDARGVLPTNILTNICSSFSLRTVTDLVRKRSSSRTQGEYRNVLEAMKEQVIEVHPWAKMFIDRNFDIAAMELELMLKELLPPEMRIPAIKLIDQLRKG